MREIIAFIGRAGSGKDYQSNLLVEKGFKKIAFADSMREIVRQTLGMDRKRFYDNYEKYKQTYLFENQTLRNILENIGSAIRCYDNEFFIKALINRIYKEDMENENICISDLRYIDEFRAVYYKARETGDSFKCILCDYKSDRYQETNTHPSAWLSNTLVQLDYKDLQEVKIEDIHNLMGEFYGTVCFNN